MRDAAEMPDEVIADFENKNPNIKVDVVENDFTKLMTMIAGGNPPDVFRVNGIGLPYWIRKDFLKDITSKLEQEIDMKDLFPVNGMYRFDGSIQGKGPYYGLVKDWSLDYMYYYNKDALAEAGVANPSDDTPLSTAEFTQMINKAVVYRGGKVERYGFAYTDDEFNGYFLTMLASKGKWLFTEDGTKLNIDDPDVYNLFKWWFDEAKDHHAMPSPLDPAPDWGGPLLQAGRLAIMWDGYWFGPIINEGGQIPPDRFGFAPAPVHGNKRVHATGGGTGYVIFNGTKAYDAAWTFWAYYMLEDEAVARAKSGWGLPAFKSLLKYCPQDTSFDAYRLNQVKKELPYQIILQFPSYLRETALVSAFNQHMEPALKGAISFDTALKNLAEQINSVIATVFIWKTLFNRESGLINIILALFNPNVAQNFLVDLPTFTLILMFVWQAGGSMIIFLAGLQNIPKQLVEAADIDGASGFLKLVKIILPLMSPIILYQAVVGIMLSFSVIVQPILLTSSPGAAFTAFLNQQPPLENYFTIIYAFQQCFTNQSFGYGMAVVWMMFIIMLLLTFVFLKIINRLVYYEHE